MFLPLPSMKRPCQRRQEDDEQATARDIAEVKKVKFYLDLNLNWPRHCRGENKLGLNWVKFRLDLNLNWARHCRGEINIFFLSNFTFSQFERNHHKSRPATTVDGMRVEVSFLFLFSLSPDSQMKF